MQNEEHKKHNQGNFFVTFASAFCAFCVHSPILGQSAETVNATNGTINTNLITRLSITECGATRIQRSQVKRVDAAKIGDTLGDLGLMAGDPPSHGALGGKKDMPRDKRGILFATNVPALFRCQQEMLDSRDHPQPAFTQPFRLRTGTKRQFFEKNSFKPDVLRQLPVHYYFRNDQLFEKRHVRPDLRERLVSRLL